MDQQNNQQNIIDETNYLVTKQVDTSSIPVETTKSDLDLLCKAETKSKYRADISKGIKNPQLQRAISSLRLVNPFKGY
ncbi:MAG: hypothetical protein AB9915_01390 [Candidatus Dojkabacteria bacterium]